MRILAGVEGPGLEGAVARALDPLGHDVAWASDGPGVLAVCRDWAPDLLILGPNLGTHSGLELARRLRLETRRDRAPMVMLVLEGEPRPETFQGGLDAGITAFVLSPFDPQELRCRVTTLARMGALQEDLRTSQARAEEELEAVKHFLARLSTHGQPEPPPGFHMETVQTERVNGDACIYRQSIPGIHYGLICDATGHGLMAGVSTIPVVDTFLAMVRRDIPLATIYQEIHRKLKRLLPTGRFACLLLMRVDVAQGVLSVLNAGMPPVLLLQEEGRVQTFPSRVLPAGIAGVDPGVAVVDAGIRAGDRIFACSDGLGDRVTPEALVEEYLKGPSPLNHGGHCEAIRSLVRQSTWDGAHDDDITWALWEVPGVAVPLRPGAPAPPCAGERVQGFRCTLTLDPRFHSARDLIPHVLNLMADFQVSQAKAQLFGMLLSEALTNAVDHGLLRLDSSLKAKGFEEYEQGRKEALEAMTGGWVTCDLSFHHAPGPPPTPLCRIQAEVEDSGPGFDWQSWLREPGTGETRPFGRGIALLSGLAQELEFNAAGNRVRFALEAP